MKNAEVRDAPHMKFWNVVSLDADHGEICLYGDIVDRQPIDWWTGEPDERQQYITPQGFLEDLELVRDKANVTVRLNSGGGDLYTGIAIHNALKSLSGEVEVIVEGIAASAASVIMCAGDTVKAYPGSLVMIHGVSVLAWDYMNLQDAKKLVRGMDASEKAIAEIYHQKTGILTDTLRDMMERETWMTGQEALEKGFADEVIDGDVEMSLSADRKFLMVNHATLATDGMRNMPKGIPIQKAKKPKRQQEERRKGMTLEELKAQEPELVASIEEAARKGYVPENTATEAANKVVDGEVAKERKRLQEIDEIAASMDPALVVEAKYGENPCTAQELAYRAVKQDAIQGRKFLADMAADSAASGANAVTQAPNGGCEAMGRAKNGPKKSDVDEGAVSAVMDAVKKSRERKVG